MPLMLRRSRKRGLRIVSIILAILVFAVIGYLVLHDSKAAVSADINGDGSVGIADLTVLAANYGLSGKNFSQGDITGDGLVNIYDFSILAAQWNTGSGATNPSCTWPGVANQKFPCAADTGVPAGTTLHALGTNGCPSTGDLGTADATYTACDFTDGLNITAANVHVVNSQISSNIVNNSTGFVLTYSTVTSSGCNGIEAIGYGNYELNHVKVTNYSDGPRVAGSNIYIHDSYIATCFNAGDHADGIQSNGGGGNVLIEHNTIANVTNCTQANAAVFVADSSLSQTYDNNYLSCGQYVMQLLAQDSPNGTILTGTNNVFGNNTWGFGPCNNGNSNTGTNAHFVVSNNRLENGTLISSCN